MHPNLAYTSLHGINHSKGETTVTSTAVAFTPVDSGNAPATLKIGWLPPDSGIPELDELRAEYERIAAQHSAEFAEVWRLTQEIEASEKRLEQARKSAYLNGTDPAEAGDQGIEALRESLAAARQRQGWAGQGLIDLINKAVGTVVEKHDEWIAALDDENAPLRAELAEAEARARELRTRAEGGGKLREWLRRTAVDGAEMPAAHFPYDEMPDAVPTDPAELADWKQQIMERAIYGGSPFARISDPEREHDEADVGRRYNREQEQAIEGTNDRMSEAARDRLRFEMAGEAGVI
jgi:hypothetical protein